MPRSLNSLLGLALSILLLAWAAHGVQFDVALSYLGHARVLPLLGAVALATLTLPLRAVRWRYTLRPHGTPLPFAALFHAAAIGTMANNVLPVRMGEFARAYAIGKLARPPFVMALASILVERVLDGLVIVGLMIGALVATHSFSIQAGATWSLGLMALLAGLLLLGALGVVIVVAGGGTLFAGVVGWLNAHVRSEAVRQRVTRFAELVVLGLGVVRNRRHLRVAVGLSVVIWLVNGAAIGLGLSAFGMDLPWAAPAVVQALIALGIAVPSSPGFFGPFEAACRVALVMYGLEPERALGFALPFHVLAYFVPVTLIGFWSLTRVGLSLKELRRQSQSERVSGKG